MRRIAGDWLHWAIGTKCHLGFHRYGVCWSWTLIPRIQRYGNGVTWFSWWRFFLAIGCLLFAIPMAGCQQPVVGISVTGNINEPDGSATVVLSRSDGLAGDVTVNLAYSGTATPADYVGAVKSIAVPSARGATAFTSGAGSASFQLSAVDDKIHEAPKVLTVSIVPSANYTIAAPGSVDILAADDDPETPPPPPPQPPDESFDGLAGKITEWRALWPPGLASQSSAIGQVYLDAADGLDSLTIGSIGQAGKQISEATAKLVQQTDRSAWDAFAAKVDAVWVKYQVSSSRDDAVKFLRIVGEALK